MLPKASVCLITYNHEKYLEKCLDSIISQEHDCSIEIVIGEDNSTDSTPLIVQKYANLYPNLIRVISSNNNVGMVANWKRTLKACKGEYIAIIEGDDFWSSPLKLQKQINLLEENKSYALSFHDVDVIFNDNIEQIDPLTRYKEQNEFTIQDVITKNWFIPTCSMMVRKTMLADLPTWTKNLKAIDIVVQLLAATNGNIGYINEKLGTYTIHRTGQSQIQWLGKENTFDFTTIEILKKFNKHTNGKYDQYVQARLQRSFLSLLSFNLPWSKYYFKAMFGLILLNPSKNITILKDWIIVNAIPKSIYRIYRKLTK